MRWTITIDHTGGGDAGRGNFTGRAAELPFSFRLYDDDGELYYSGRSDDRDSEKAFAPLDWAMRHAGCTEIKYQEGNGLWLTL